MEGRATPDSLASELSSRSLLGKQSSFPDGKENEIDAKRAGFMAPTQSSLRKKDIVPSGGQPLGPARMNSAKLAIPEEAPMETTDAPAVPVARSMQDLRSRIDIARRSSTVPLGSGGLEEARPAEPRMKTAADQILFVSEFKEQAEKVLAFKPTTSQYDYKNRLEEYRGHINNLRKVIKRMNENEGTFVTEALRFERDVDQTIEGYKLRIESVEKTCSSLEQDKCTLEARIAKIAADAREAAAKADATITDLKRNAKAAAEDATRKQAKAAQDISRVQEELANAKSTISQLEAAQAAAHAARAEVAGERDRTALELAHSREAEVRYQAQIRQMEGELRAMAAEAEAERGRGRQAAADFAAQLRAAEETVESWQERCRVGAAQAAKQQEEAAAEAQALSGQIAAKENELRMMEKANSERLHEAEKHIAQLLAEKAGLSDRCSSISSATTAAEAERDRARASLERAEAAYAALRDQERETAAAAARLEAEALSLRKRIDDLQSSLDRAEGGGRAASESLAAYKARLESSEAEREAERERLGRDRDRLLGEAAELRAQNTQLVGSNGTMTAELRSLREKVEAAEALAREEAERGRRAAEEARRDGAARLAEAAAAAAAAEARAQKELAEAKAAAQQQLEAAKEAAAAALASAQADAAAAKASAETAYADLKAQSAEQLESTRQSAANQLAAAKAEAAAAISAADAALADHKREAAAQLAAARQQAAEQLAAAEAKAAAAERASAEAVAALRAALSEATDTAAKTAAELQQAVAALAEAESRRSEAESRLAGVIAQLESESQELQRLRSEMGSALEAARAEAAAASAAAAHATAAEASARSELDSLRNVLTSGDGAGGVAISGDIAGKLVALTRSNADAQMRAAEADSLRSQCEQQRARIAQLEESLLDAEALRRKLHNQIQDLRGNVRVFCRVRPPAEEEAAVQCPLDGSTVQLAQSGGQQHAFGFDRVFAPGASQAEVFEEVSQLVQSALDGYKVCLFSYGQTGSGKTHTMLGSGMGDDRGIIPRAVETVLQAAERLGAKGWSFTMHASYVEIYNEQIRDLLRPGSAHSDKHGILHGPNGVTEVTGAAREAVPSVEAAKSLVRRAAAARAVEATQMNAQSSRSHTIFMLYITGVHEGAGQKLTGTLNLVDLAGSERVSRSGATGDRFKEACAINKSLSCLGDVFQAIGNKQSHIPYRNSKLTYLLSPCLGGDGKTLMFVNVAPESSSAEETLCSLRFGAMVNAVELTGGKGARGGAKRNLQPLALPAGAAMDAEGGDAAAAEGAAAAASAGPSSAASTPASTPRGGPAAGQPAAAAKRPATAPAQAVKRSGSSLGLEGKEPAKKPAVPSFGRK